MNPLFEGRWPRAFLRVSAWGGEQAAAGPRDASGSQPRLSTLAVKPRGARSWPLPELQAPEPGYCSAPLCRGGQAARGPGGAGHAWRAGPAGKGHVSLTCGTGIGSSPAYIGAGGGRPVALPGALRFSSRAGERTPAGVSHGGWPVGRGADVEAGAAGWGGGCLARRVLVSFLLDTDVSAPPGNSRPTSRRLARPKSGRGRSGKGALGTAGGLVSGPGSSCRVAPACDDVLWPA